MLAWAAPIGLLLALSACEAPPPSTGDAKTDAAILQACRERANAAYDRRNRAEIYSPQYGGASPLSGTYTDVGVNRDLSARFAFEQMVRDCVRTANVSGQPPVAPTSSAPTSSAPAGSVPQSGARIPGASAARPPAGTALPPPGMGTRR